MDEELLLDLFASLPDADVRRMFGGQGVFCGGLMVAVVISGELYLKTDAETEAAFQEAGSLQWTYARKDRAAVRMSFYRLPDAAFDDPDEMALWAHRALDAARRSAIAKPKKSRRKVAAALDDE
ncbi:TfoX/Sxy family protein [Consotaella aegiceratis]|uniref:TfoX/Sxy family protein n=1 Tax=Consotaella aegiceratis TaxID=3097961 RepID=UPI002F3E929C